MDIIITIPPVVAKDLPISPRFTPYDFLSRCKFSTLTTRQLMVEFYLLTFPRFPLRKKEHKSYFGKNRTHDFRTSKCAVYLLDHSGDVMYTVYRLYRRSVPEYLEPLMLMTSTARIACAISWKADEGRQAPGASDRPRQEGEGGDVEPQQSR